MTTATQSARTLDYTRITGPGVDALDRRREHNNNEAITAEKLQSSIDKVKSNIFESLKALTVGAVQLTKK
jgi:hypothetical protein